MRFIGNVEKDAQIRAVASGALPSGDAVIINADGTVSVAAEGSFTPVVFEDGASSAFFAVFDSAANRVVIAYRDNGNSLFGTAVVGTVSGTAISFGTPVVFESTSTNNTAAVFDTSTNKVVIAYSVDDPGVNTGRGRGIVGTVSGTSISFGTGVDFQSLPVFRKAIVYDSNANKVVVVYERALNVFGNSGAAIVGTVSGTSISFGAEVAFASTGAVDGIGAAFDTSTNKVVIAINNRGVNPDGLAFVGTVSGTSISFGAETAFANDIIGPRVVFDTSTNKVVIAYGDNLNGDFGTAVVATVSGTSISFGTPVVFRSVATNVRATTFDSILNKVVFAYLSSSDLGLAIRGTVTGTSISFDEEFTFEGTAISDVAVTFDSVSNNLVFAYRATDTSGTALVYGTNLTDENFIGFAAHTYADAQSALVNSTCTVDRNQSGLTAGQTYYVQNDGTLGTTAGNPSVVAGTAISSTSIIVKG